MKKDFNNYLKTLSPQELIKEIQKLYSKFEPIRQYYELELGNNSEQILEEFKAQIKKEYFPTRGFGKARSSVSRKVITDFKKIAVHQKDVIELLLYRVEMMIDFSLEYGDIGEDFYTSLENNFEEACKLITKEKLQSKYEEDCETLVGASGEFGYGTCDTLAVFFGECFGREPLS